MRNLFLQAMRDYGMKQAMIGMLLLMLMAGCSTKSELKPRLVVCTDIAPADVEPDDMESMVRLMAYADQLEIEALITSVGWNCDPYPKEWAEYLGRVIDRHCFRQLDEFRQKNK